jgi:hypothetical protein
MTPSTKGLYVTLNVNDTEHNNALQYEVCHYVECPILLIAFPSVIMLSVVAPFCRRIDPLKGVYSRIKQRGQRTGDGGSSSI